MNAPRTAVFDLDGTLVDSAPDIRAAANHLAAARGLAPFTMPEVIGMIGDGIRVFVARALAARGLPFDEESHARFAEDYSANAAVLTRPFDGIPEALDALQSAGWRLCVCTNKPEEPARTLLRDLGLAPRFAAIGGGDSFPTRKPDPAHLRATLAAAGGDASRAVMIGDHHNDVAAAAGLGIPCVFVLWGYGTRAMAAQSALAAAPRELPELLARLEHSPFAWNRAAG